MQREKVTSDWMSIGLTGGGTAATCFETTGENNIKPVEHDNALIPKSSIQLVSRDDKTLVLTGRINVGELEVRLEPDTGKRYRLTGRGFRWINEVPFNR